MIPVHEQCAIFSNGCPRLPGSLALNTVVRNLRVRNVSEQYIKLNSRNTRGRVHDLPGMYFTVFIVVHCTKESQAYDMVDLLVTGTALCLQ